MQLKTGQLTKDLSITLGVATMLTLCTILFNWDTSLAHAVFDPKSTFGLFLRQYSNIPGVIISLAVLAFLFVPKYRIKHKTLRRFAIIWFGTLVLGGGLMAGAILKNGVDRPRPRDSVLIEQPAHFSPVTNIAQAAELKGKSFPSGHAAMAYMFVVPFFVFRKKRPALATALLLFGLAYGSAVGYARMVLGAHFLTDIIWSAAIILSTAAILDKYITRKTDLKTLHLIGFFAFAGACVVYFNKFDITLTWEKKDNVPIIALNLPCGETQLGTLEDVSRITVNLRGYGAPLSYLKLKDRDGVISLDRYKGFYRNLSCDVNVMLGPNQKVVLPVETPVKHVPPKAWLDRKTRTHYTFKNPHDSVKK